jgi:hypothetical protein
LIEYFEAYPYDLKSTKNYLFFNPKTQQPIKRGQAWKFITRIYKEVGLRGLMKVNIEGAMIAAGQNLKRRLKHKLELFCVFFKKTFFLGHHQKSQTFSTACKVT